MARQRGLLAAPDFAACKWYYSVAANLSRVSDEELIAYQRRAYDLFQARGRAALAGTGF
jgi:hypothetical protein